jgi:segregation and condensation protein B
LPPLADPSAQLNADLLGQHAIEFADAVPAIEASEADAAEAGSDAATLETGAVSEISASVPADHEANMTDEVADIADLGELRQDGNAGTPAEPAAEASAHIELQAGATESELNHDPVSQADPAIPAHDSGVLRDTEHAAEPNPATAARGDHEDRRDTAQDAGILTDDEPESRSA